MSKLGDIVWIDYAGECVQGTYDNHHLAIVNGGHLGGWPMYSSKEECEANIEYAAAGEDRARARDMAAECLIIWYQHQSAEYKDDDSIAEWLEKSKAAAGDAIRATQRFAIARNRLEGVSYVWHGVWTVDESQ